MQGKARNPKSEIRNKSEIRTKKTRNNRRATVRRPWSSDSPQSLAVLDLGFLISNLFRISDFEFRAFFSLCWWSPAKQIRRGIGPLEGALLLGERVTAIEGTVLRFGHGDGGAGAITGGGPLAWVMHRSVPG
jgi:hypothetical protein